MSTLKRKFEAQPQERSTRTRSAPPTGCTGGDEISSVVEPVDASVAVACTIRHLQGVTRITVDQDAMLLFRMLYSSVNRHNPLEVLAMLACCKVVAHNRRFPVPVGLVPEAQKLMDGKRPRAFDLTPEALCSIVVALSGDTPKGIPATLSHNLLETHLVPGKSTSVAVMTKAPNEVMWVVLALKAVYSNLCTRGVFRDLGDRSKWGQPPDAIEIIVTNPKRCLSPAESDPGSRTDVVLDMTTFKKPGSFLKVACDTVCPGKGPTIKSDTFVSVVHSLDVVPCSESFVLRPDVQNLLFKVLVASQQAWVSATVPEVLVVTLLLHLLFHFGYVSSLMSTNRRSWPRSKAVALKEMRSLCTCNADSVRRWSAVFASITDPRIVTGLPHPDVYAHDPDMFCRAVQRTLALSVFGVQTMRSTTRGRPWWEVCDSRVDLRFFFDTGLYAGLQPEPEVRTKRIVDFTAKHAEWTPVPGRIGDLTPAITEPSVLQLEAMYYYHTKAVTSFQAVGADLIKQMFGVDLTRDVYDDSHKRTHDLLNACSIPKCLANVMTVKRL